MAVRESKLIAFANIGAQWAPCGQLALTEEGSNLIASSFAYGLNYLKRSDALEVDPVSLSIADRSSVAGKYLLPVNALHFFGGIRDAAPDSWGRRVIEASSRRRRTVWPIGVPPACRKRARGGARYPFEQDRFADVWRVVREWRVYFDEFGVDAAEMDKAAPAFRHIDDISTPELRKLLP
jgi:hypothetical protein